MIKITRTMLLVCVFALAAGTVRAQKRSSVITLEEIERAGPTVGTAYDAVNTLRPRWLRAPREMLQLPGSGREAQIARVHVYMDDHDMGDVDYLKDIPAVRVQELRWLSPFDAASRFGPTEGQAAILVTLKRGG